jgi:hypothetical protein
MASLYRLFWTSVLLLGLGAPLTAAAQVRFTVACHAQFATTPAVLRAQLPADADFDRCSEVRNWGEAARRLPPSSGSPSIGPIVVDAFLIGYNVEDSNVMWLRGRLLARTELTTPVVLWDLRRFGTEPRARIEHAVTLEETVVRGVSSSVSGSAATGTVSLQPKRIRWRAWSSSQPTPPSIDTPAAIFCYDLGASQPC